MNTSTKKKTKEDTSLNDLSRELDELGMEWQVPMVGKVPGIKKGGYPGFDDRSLKDQHLAEGHIDGVAVSMLPNGLLGYDCDPDDVTTEQWAKAEAWIGEHLQSLIDGGQAWVQRSARKRGFHVILKHPGETVHVPGQIMPGITMRNRNYIRIYETSGFKADKADLAPPSKAAITQVEGAAGHKDGSGVLSWDDAIEVLATDGKTGARHEAVNSLAIWIVREDPEIELEAACDELALLIEEVMPDNERRRDLLDLSYDPPSELVRSVKRLMPGGPMRMKAVGDQGTDRLAEALQAKVKREAETVLRTGKVPSLFLKGDATKGWLDAVRAKVENMTPEELAEADTGERIESDYVVVDLSGLRNKVLPQTQWQIENVLPFGTLWGIAGPTGAGKTHFGTAMSASLSVGATEIIGMPPAPVAVPVLYLANEMWAEDMEARLQATLLRNGIDAMGKVVVRGQKSGPLRMTKANVKELHRVCVEHEIGMVILDHFASAHVGKENVSDEVAETMLLMKEVLQLKPDMTVGFMHHVPKQESYEDMRGNIAAFRGSGGIADWLDFGWTIMPYLPGDAVGGKGDAKRRRQHIKDAQAAGDIPKYVVVDVAKPRKGTGHAPIWYELSGVELPNGDVEAALVPVTRAEADRVMRGAATDADSRHLASALQPAKDALQQIGEHLGWPEGFRDVPGKVAAEALGMDVSNPRWSTHQQLIELAKVAGGKWIVVDQHEIKLHVPTTKGDKYKVEIKRASVPVS